MIKRYAGLDVKDRIEGRGSFISFFVADDKCGIPLPHNIIDQIISAFKASKIQKGLYIRGGEPLNKQNKKTTYYIVNKIRKALPPIEIYLKTNYTIKEILSKKDNMIYSILNNIDYLMEGSNIWIKWNNMWIKEDT